MASEPFNPVRFTRNALLIGGGVGLCIWAWVALFQPNLFPKRFHTVQPGELYRAGKLTPAAVRTVVEERDIRTIVDLGAWTEGSREDRLAQRVADSLGVDRIRLNLHGDATGDPENYVRALKLVTDPTRQPVLLHCGAGTERTGCAIMLYRTIIQGEDADAAYDEAQRIGHSPTRNDKMRPTFDAVRPLVEAALTESTDPAPEG